MSLTSLGIKAFLASDKGMAVSFVAMFSATVGYGVIVLAQGDGGVANPSTRVARAYVLVSAAPDTAVIDSPEGRRSVRVGSILPGLGTITTIVDRGDRWVVSTASGQSLSLKKAKA